MNRFDITQTNAAVERLIETTENPRHLYLLHAYNRHRYLEMAGRFEEIFTPEMMVERPVYRFNLLDTTTTLDGAEAVKEVYRGVDPHGSVHLLHRRRREACGERRHDRLDVDAVPAVSGGRPCCHRCARRPRRYLLGKDGHAHDLAIRRPWTLDR